MSEVVNKAVVCVTREKNGGIQVLVTRSAKTPEVTQLPVGPIASKEHPCEAALRILGEQTGTSDYVSFHKLTPTKDTDTHTFHTTSEASLPDTWNHADASLAWINLQDDAATKTIENLGSLKTQILD